MMTRIRRIAAAAGTAALLWGCDATEPPKPGVLTAHLSGTLPGDAALVVTIDGPALPSEVSAEAGYTVHSRTQGEVTTVAVFGELAGGPVFRFSIPDEKLASRFNARVREVDDGEFSLREDLTSYAVRLDLQGSR